MSSNVMEYRIDIARERDLVLKNLHLTLRLQGVIAIMPPTQPVNMCGWGYLPCCLTFAISKIIFTPFFAIFERSQKSCSSISAVQGIRMFVEDSYEDATSIILDVMTYKSPNSQLTQN